MIRVWAEKVSKCCNHSISNLESCFAKINFLVQKVNLIESLSNGDSNKNGEKQNNKFARASCFCQLLDYNVKFHSHAHVLWRAWTRDGNFLFFCFSELWYSPLEFNSRKIPQHLTNWMKWKRVLKFGTARIQFSGDVFAAFAFAVA